MAIFQDYTTSSIRGQKFLETSMQYKVSTVIDDIDSLQTWTRYNKFLSR